MSGEAALARAALGYIARGWPVFVLTRSKVPVALCDRCREEHVTAEQMESCGCLLCHGFYAATLDEDRARAMARLHPRGLLAIRTGAASGTAVIDVDAPEGLATMRDLMLAGLLPRTVAAATGGGGYHLVYGHPGGKVSSGAGKCGAGVDSKSDGAYVVVAPSVHPRTRQPYRWLSSFTAELTPLPGHWVQRLAPPRAASSPAWSAPVVQAGSYAAAALSGEAASVAAAPSGQRNDVLNKAAFRLGQLVGAGSLTAGEVTGALMLAAAACGLSAEDGIRACETTIRSGLRGGMASPRCAA